MQSCVGIDRVVLACNGAVQTLQDNLTSRVRKTRADDCDDLACNERRQTQAKLSRLVLASTQLIGKRYHVLCASPAP